MGRGRRLQTLILVLLWALSGWEAWGAERTGALVLATASELEELADPCSEVLVAAVSAKEDAEVVGKEEFLARMGLADRTEAERCLKEQACLAQAEAKLGLGALVVGYLTPVPGGNRLLLYRLAPTGAQQGRASAEFPPGLEPLLGGIPSLADELYRVQAASLRVTVRPPGPARAQVYLDDRPVGTTPLSLPHVPVGLHRLRVEAIGHEVYRTAIEIGELGASVEAPLAAAATPSPPPPPPSGPAAEPSPPPPPGEGPGTLVWSLGVASVAAFGTGGVLHGLSWGDAQTYLDASDRQEQLEARSRGTDRWTAAKVCYGLGAGLAAAAGAAALLDAPEATATAADGPEGARLQVLPLAGEGTAGLLLGGRF